MKVKGMQVIPQSLWVQASTRPVLMFVERLVWGAFLSIWQSPLHLCKIEKFGL